MRYLAILTAILMIGQPLAFAQTRFAGWPDDRVIEYRGTMVRVVQQLDASTDRPLPPLNEEQQYWVDQMTALNGRFR